MLNDILIECCMMGLRADKVVMICMCHLNGYRVLDWLFDSSDNIIDVLTIYFAMICLLLPDAEIIDRYDK